jgi:archaellum component FlaC
MTIDNSIQHIENALKDLDNEVEKILLDWGIPLNEKDNLMLPILQQKRVLSQTLEDLKYLKANPPRPNQPCGISKYRDD